jgi:hypothetical protein
MNIVLGHTIKNTEHVIVIAMYNHFFKNETVFLRVLVRQAHPQGSSLYIAEGIQAFILLVIFLIYYDKMFTKMNTFLYILES